MKHNVAISFRPFTGEQEIIQDLALYQWSKQADTRLIVLDGGEEGVKDRCDKYNLQRVTNVLRGDDVGFKTPRFLLTDYFKKAKEACDEDCKVFTYANSDVLVMDDGLWYMLQQLDELSGGFYAVLYRRINLVNWRKLCVTDDDEQSIRNIRKDMFDLGTLNYPGVGDLTSWSMRALDRFLDEHPVVALDLLGVDRLWLTRHIDINYKLFDLSWTMPLVHPYHVQDHWRPDEKYATQFVRKIWPELWCQVQKQVKLLSNGMMYVEYVKTKS